MKPWKEIPNKYCPLSRTCCYSVTLKVGTIIIAFLGLIPSFQYIMLLSIGEEILSNFGVGPDSATVVIHAYAVLGILLASVHIILIFAALSYSESLILLYLWFGLIYFVVDIILILIVGITAMCNNLMLPGWFLIGADILYWICLYLYVYPVVNGFRRNIHTVVIVLG